MSQKKGDTGINNSAKCLIDTSAITRSTMKVYRIRWTIENFSQLPLDTKIMGPDFYLTKACLCNISFMMNENNLYVYLNSKSDRIIKIERSLVLFDCEGTILHQDNMGFVYTLEKDTDMDIISNVRQRKRFNSLKDDILIIDCHLKTEGYITTKTRFFKLGRESRDHLLDDLKTMFNNSDDSDFIIHVGNEIIHSHKNILRARSSYFKKMFEIEMKESAENNVTITDLSHATMQKLIEFLYTGDFTETLESNIIQQLSELYFASDKYGVMDLRALCAEKLMSIATSLSICHILQLAHCHNDQDLKISAMTFVACHFSEIAKSDTWKKIISTELALGTEVLNFCFTKLLSL